ncbi:fimbrial protein [Serratia fonticola]|uniref:fimbrial protein n=1 Tax=Serratia fonticola TaxID=47917 RepID=UPI002097DD4A|nr:fimbrial protein [Serratia fonticola]MCO7511995.1 fimbrial protein [Serratia fonticola]
MMATVCSWTNAWVAGLGATFLLLVSPLVTAVTVTVSVIVVAPPPCVINGDQPIDVSFDEVVTTRVDGYNYMREVPYSVQCTGQLSNDMVIRIQGDGAGFGTNVLGTNQANLGIALLNNGQPQPLNRAIKFTYPNTPKLKVVPVKFPGSTLKAAEFSAGATMKVDYQ